MAMKRQEYKVSMVPIDLKKLGSLPYCEMNARATVRPEHDGYIEIIIPCFEQDGLRVLKEITLNRKLVETPKELKQMILESQKSKGDKNET